MPQDTTRQDVLPEMNEKTMKNRKIDIAVISDVHLATHASKAKLLNKYLKSISPDQLVLNGDIIDSWRFSRSYFPKSHLKVVRQLIKMLEKGVRIYYITGNHDEFLRKFNPTQLGNLQVINQLILEIDNQKTWIFHGDIFDHVIHRAKWLAKLGSAVYGFLSLTNKLLNQGRILLGLREVLIYKGLKDLLTKEKSELTRSEKLIQTIAKAHDYQTVICGHTHQPLEKMLTPTIRYINGGDWVEHLTAVEYVNHQWSLLHFNDYLDDQSLEEPEIPSQKELYEAVYRELAFTTLLSSSKN